MTHPTCVSHELLALGLALISLVPPPNVHCAKQTLTLTEHTVRFPNLHGMNNLTDSERVRRATSVEFKKSTSRLREAPRTSQMVHHPLLASRLHTLSGPAYLRACTSYSPKVLLSPQVQSLHPHHSHPKQASRFPNPGFVAPQPRTIYGRHQWLVPTIPIG